MAKIQNERNDPANIIEALSFANQDTEGFVFSIANFAMMGDNGG